MVGYWRTLMLIKCGGPDVRELPATPMQKETAVKHAEQLSLDAIMAGLDVWTAAKSRMRDNAHAQVLLEMAVVRLARMEELLAVGQLASALSQGRVAVPALVSSTARIPSPANESTDSAKKNGTVMATSAAAPERSNPQATGHSMNASSLAALWDRVNRHASERFPMLASHLKLANLPAIFGPNMLVIRFQSEYNQAYEMCDADENIRRIEEILLRECGEPIKVACELVTDSGPERRPSQSVPSASPRPVQGSDRKKQLMGLPLFRKAGEALGAQIWHVDEDFNPAVPSRTAGPNPTDTDSDRDEI
jgi:DNA polymerase-3 subunit gamma/tau